MTPAQRRALEWLPADGSWRRWASRMTAALNSASLAGLCEHRYAGSFSEPIREWRITEKGKLALEKELQK